MSYILIRILLNLFKKIWYYWIANNTNNSRKNNIFSFSNKFVFWPRNKEVTVLSVSHFQQVSTLCRLGLYQVYHVSNIFTFEYLAQHRQNLLLPVRGVNVLIAITRVLLCREIVHSPPVVLLLHTQQYRNDSKAADGQHIAQPLGPDVGNVKQTEENHGDNVVPS